MPDICHTSGTGSTLSSQSIISTHTEERITISIQNVMCVRTPHKMDTVQINKVIIIQPQSRTFNSLTPNNQYSGRTTPLTSKCCILYIYSTNTVTAFLNMVYTLRFSSSKCSLFHNSNIFGSCIIHILYTGCAKIKKK